MTNVVPGGLAVLVFVLILSVWNWITSSLPASPSGHAQWIVILLASLAALTVYYITSGNR